MRVPPTADVVQTGQEHTLATRQYVEFESLSAPVTNPNLNFFQLSILNESSSRLLD